MKPIVYEELKVGDEVVTRDGRKGLVLCVDAKSKYPVVCLLKSETEEHEYPHTFTSDGRYDSDGTESCADIFLPSERVKLKIYKCDDGYAAVEQVDGRPRFGGRDCYNVFSTGWREVAEIEVEI